MIAPFMKSFKLNREYDYKTKKSIPHKILDHIFAVLISFFGLLLTTFITPPISDTPMLIFFPIIIISAWNGGLSAGILTSILSALFINLHPLQNFQLSARLDFPYALQFILFVTEGAFISFIIHILQLREKIGEYKKREKDLNKTILDLIEKNKNYEKEIHSRDEFLSIASHELKTPLTSMLLQTQTALHNIRNVSVAQFSFENLLKMLESVENQTKRLSKMINDLLAVSVITVGNLQLEYEEIDLEKLVRGVLTDFAARIEREKVEVIYQNPPEKIVGYWDKIRIEQAVSNFVSNAIKYGEHKPIEIKTKKSKNHIELIVIDHGIGIPKHKLKSIFELFQRAVSPDKYKGLGVGLYITQKIIAAHNGSVEVKSWPEKGSEFTMRLPLNYPRSRKEIYPNARI
jgi:signal transduction histidine kinase